MNLYESIKSNSKTHKTLSEMDLSEKAWDYTIQSGRHLRSLISSVEDDCSEEVCKSVVSALIKCCKEAGERHPDEYARESFNSFADEMSEDLETQEYDSDFVDYLLSEFYDLCDNTNTWIPLNDSEELKESFKEVLKQGKRGSEPVALVYWEGSRQPYVLAIGFNEEEHNWDYGYYFSYKETAERAFDFVCKGGNMHHFDEADETEHQKRICPRCGKVYVDFPAISRFDNKTEICPACGTDEAMLQYMGEELTDPNVYNNFMKESNPAFKDKYKVTINGEEIKPGYKIKDFRGDEHVFLGVTNPGTPFGGQNGKIRVARGNGEMEYYPSVFNAKLEKINEADEETQDINVAQANQVFAKLADEVEKAFAEFDGKFEFGKPTGKTDKNIDGKEFIRGFDYQFYINSTIYRFHCECYNFGKFSAEVDFGPNGYRSGNYGTFSVADGEKVLKAAKIAESLIPRIEHEISKLNIPVRSREISNADGSEIR